MGRDNPRNSNDRIRALSAYFGDLCAQLGVPYLHVFGLLVQSDLWNDEIAASDGAHPGAGGYALLAELVSSWPAWKAWF